MKGQASSEYLVILAVVLLIALIVILLLGGFTGVGNEAKIKKSRAYWQSAYPISIEETSIQNSTTTP